MSLRPHRRFILLALATLAILIGTGCGLNPPTKPPDPKVVPPPPDMKTPQHAIVWLQDAWQRRDSVATKAVYDDNYVGTSIDQTDNSTLTYTKNNEVSVVGSMQRRTEITSVAMTLQPESLWVRLTYPSDPADWTAIQLKGVNIQVDDTGLGTLVANSASFFEFKLIPTVVGADTTWKIIRWTETR